MDLRTNQASIEATRDVRFRHLCRRVHALGPRAFMELLAELGASWAIQTDIEQRLERYAELTEEMVVAADGVDIVDSPLTVVQRDEEAG